VERSIYLGRDDGAVTPAGERPSEHLLGAPLGIAGGRIDEVDAAGEGGRDRVNRFLVALLAPDRVAAESPGAEGDPGGIEIGSRQGNTLHSLSPRGTAPP